MAIKVLSFDLDNTLWPVNAVLERAERETHAWLSKRYPKLSVKYSVADLQDLRLSVAQQQPELAHDFTELRKASLRLAAEASGYTGNLTSDLAESAFKEFMRWRNRVAPYPDVIRCLEAWAKNYRLAALTNGNADLAQTAIGSYFSWHLNAQHCGAAKPEPAMFQALIEQSACSAAEIVHIGDDPVADVLGAQQAGLQGIWLQREDCMLSLPKHIQPDATIHSLTELSTHL